MSETTMLENAIKYAQKGLAVFPCHNIGPNGCSCDVKTCDKPGKHPRTLHGHKDATTDEKMISTYWYRFPNANIGCATGSISGIVVLDIDAKHGRSGSEFRIPPTVTAKTGGGGNHFFFKHPGYPVKSTNGQVFGVGVDIKADGGYVILAPSSHASGSSYEWLVSPEDEDFAPIPIWLSDALKKQNENKESEKLWKLDPADISEGMRNETAASMAGKIRYSLASGLRETVGWPGLLAWNRQMSKPLHEKELRVVWESISKYDSSIKQNEVYAKKDIEIKFRLWSIGDILKHDFGEEEWCVKNLISKQGMTALSGNPGDHKTWITIHIALSSTRKTSVFGKFESAGGAVLIIDEEDHIRLLKKRLELLGANDTDNIYYLSQNGIKVDVDAVRDEILKIIKEKNIKLLILDSLVRVHGQEENDAKGMAKVFSSLQPIMKAGASILFTHHHRKQFGINTNTSGQSMRGSSDILAAVDCHITIEKKRDDPGSLIIKQTKLRQGEILQPFEVTILKGDLGPSGFEYAGEHDEKKKKAIEASEGVALLLAEGMKCRTDLIDLLQDEELGKSAIEEGIKLAEAALSIERVPKEELRSEDRKKAWYRLPQGTPNLLDDQTVDDELPASSPYIEVEKQEVTTNEFDNS